MATTAAPRMIPPRNDAASKLTDGNLEPPGVVVNGDGSVVMLTATTTTTQGSVTITTGSNSGIAVTCLV